MYVINSEGEHVFVGDGINDCVGMKFYAKGLLGSSQLRVIARGGVDGKDRSSCKTKEVVVTEGLFDCCMHVAELRSMAFIKDKNYSFFGY